MKKKIIAISIIICIGVILGIGLYINNALNKVNYVTNNEKVEIMEETFEVNEDLIVGLEVKPSDLNWNNDLEEEIETNQDLLEEIEEEKTYNITNILLCGEENQSGAKRGRTDCMILASINMDTKTMRLISFMRDLYVPIEGYSNNKLNASYAIGGMPLLVSTLEKDFEIKIDGYVLVDFAQFENLIDLLGGVEITLSDKEASYLNKNNFIKSSKNRNLVVGTQLVNGEQALGYSRIRYVSTPNGLSNDFGRVWRQKQVVLSIYEKYRNISYTKMLELLPDVLSIVTTNLNKEELMKLGMNVLSLRDSELEQACVPYDGTYSFANVNGMSVLYIENIEEIRAKTKALINGEELNKVLETNISTSKGDSTFYEIATN